MDPKTVLEKYLKQNFMRKQLDKSVIITGYFNTSLSIIVKQVVQKNQKEHRRL